MVRVEPMKGDSHKVKIRMGRDVCEHLGLDGDNDYVEVIHDIKAQKLGVRKGDATNGFRATGRHRSRTTSFGLPEGALGQLICRLANQEVPTHTERGIAFVVAPNGAATNVPAGSERSPAGYCKFHCLICGDDRETDGTICLSCNSLLRTCEGPS